MNLLALLVPITLALTAPKPTVLIDQSFTLHQPGDTVADSVGIYSIHAQEDAGQIRITESVQLTIEEGTIDMTSIVVYKQNDNKAWVLHAAAATTGVDGNIVMKVNVQPSGKQWEVNTTYLRQPFGEAFDEPKKSKRKITFPAGPVLFSSARVVMGPRLQTQPGEQAIVWVEFPDDLDEDINIKEGFSLVRDKPDDQGNMMLWVRSEHQTIGPLPLDAKGKIKPHKLWDKMLMREE
jgi:hypothetical protein